MDVWLSVFVMLVVIGATDFELGGLGLPRVRRTEDLRADVIGGKERIAVTVGIGGKDIVETIRRVAGLSRGSIVVNLGFAGGLAPDLSAGTPLLIRRVQVPNSDMDPIEIDSPLLNKASRAVERHGARIADLVTVPYLATSPQQKCWLREGSLADVVDMEGYWVAAAAKDAGLDVLLLKVISDTARQSLPGGNTLLAKRGIELVLDLATHPSWAPDVARLAWTGFWARRTLASVGIELLNCLAAESRTGASVA